jgi:trimeric autotransporter adhesin
MAVKTHSAQKHSTKNFNSTNINNPLIAPLTFSSISPAIGVKTSWNPSTDGDLIITTPGEYTVVVAGVINMSKVVKMWGAGGKPTSGGSASWGAGGAGGSAVGTVTFVSGTTYKIRVPSAGNSSGTNPATAYGGGNGGGTYSVGVSGGGGGYAGIFNTSVTQGNAVLMAGGGGGGASHRSDGLGGRPGAAGGGTTGQNAADAYISSPGTQSAGGITASGGSGGQTGSALQGGNSTGGGGGGGGGYWGGGGGGPQSSQSDGGCGGGGGSGYYNPSVVTSATLYIGSGITPGNNTDTDKPNNAGLSSAGLGSAYDGAVVIKAT